MALPVSAFPAPSTQNRRRRSDDFDIYRRTDNLESPHMAERRIKPKSSLLGLFARSTTRSPVQDTIPDSAPSSSIKPSYRSSPKRQTCKLGQKIFRATVETVFMFRTAHQTPQQPDQNLSSPPAIASNSVKKGCCVPLPVDTRPLDGSSSIRKPKESFMVERTTRSLDNPERDLVPRPSALSSSPVIFARLTSSSCEISPISLGEGFPKERRKLVPPFFVNRSLYSGGCRWEITGDRDRCTNEVDTASSFSLGTISTSTSVESLAISRVSCRSKSPILVEGERKEVVEQEGPCLDHVSISESMGDETIADDGHGTLDTPWILELCSSVVGTTALDLSLIPSPLPSNSHFPSPGQSRYRIVDASGPKTHSSPTAPPSTCRFSPTKQSAPTAVKDSLTLGVHTRPLPPTGPRVRPLPPVPTRAELPVLDNHRDIFSLPLTNNSITQASAIPIPPTIRDRLFSPLLINQNCRRPKPNPRHVKTLPPLPYSPSSSSFHGPSVTPLPSSPFHHANANASQPILTSHLRSHTLPYDRSHLEDRAGISSQGFTGSRRLVHV